MSKSSPQIATIQCHESIAEILKTALAIATPPPEITTSQWADQNRVLTSENSPEPGPWETDRVPYLREMMDVLDDTSIYKVVCMMGVQLGKTELLLNRIGRSIHLDPGPMLFAFPDDESLREFSKDRVLPMIEACKPLRERIIEKKKNISKESTIKSKRFNGGYFAMVSARTAKSFMSRAIRELFMDEVDRYTASSGVEGDPIALAEKRTTNFPYNRKIVITSSPGNEGESHIAPAYENSDQRKWYCPCPHCDHAFVIMWEHVQWDSSKGPDGQTIHKPETARLVCHECGGIITELDRIRIVRAGRWVKHAPTNGIAGFWANSLMSLFTSLAIIVKEFIDAKDNPHELKVFTNTRLAETWKEKGARIDDGKLFNRRELYPAQVPDQALMLTCGVDVQDDRIEAEVRGWCTHEESWGIVYKVFWGDPDESKIWKELESFLYSTFRNRHGVLFHISATCIDSGAHTQMVYDFVRRLDNPRIFAIKGVSGDDKPVVSPPSEKRSGTDERKVKLFLVGVDQAKTLIHSRLKKTEQGGGYYHFPVDPDITTLLGYTEEYFKQLAGEERRLKEGKMAWVKIRARQEALDINVYCYAAMKLVDPQFEALAAQVQALIDKQSNNKVRKIIKKRRIISEGLR